MMMKKMALGWSFVFLMSSALECSTCTHAQGGRAPAIFDVKSYGAVADDKTDNTMVKEMTFSYCIRI